MKRILAPALVSAKVNDCFNLFTNAIQDTKEFNILQAFLDSSLSDNQVTTCIDRDELVAF